MGIDVPGRTATVQTPFLVGGWALDPSAVVGTNIDAVHVWAFPVTGAPVPLGAATLKVPRPDVAAVFGANFQEAGFNLVVTQTLKPGAYTLQIYGRRASTGTFDVVEQVPITVRGITLSDIGPCSPGQGPQFDGTSWLCATSVGATGPAGPQGIQGIQGPPGQIGAAGTPTLVIRDATGVEVGPVLGIAQTIWADTALEHSDGRLFAAMVNRDVLKTDVSNTIFFSGTDCTGKAYLQSLMNFDAGIFQRVLTVIAGPGFTLYTATGPDLPGGVFYRSTRSQKAGCSNDQGTITSPVTEAEVISQWAALQAPFSVHRK